MDIDHKHSDRKKYQCVARGCDGCPVCTEEVMMENITPAKAYHQGKQAWLEEDRVFSYAPDYPEEMKDHYIDGYFRMPYRGDDGDD